MYELLLAAVVFVVAFATVSVVDSVVTSVIVLEEDGLVIIGVKTFQVDPPPFLYDKSTISMLKFVSKYCLISSACWNCLHWRYITR